MLKIDKENYYEVIRLYLHGYSMAEVSRIIGTVSKTTVYNIVHDWFKKVSSGNIEDVRFFMRVLREKGITIEDCNEGFRTQQMLKEFEIPEEPYDWITEGNEFAAVDGQGSSCNSNHSLYHPDESKLISKKESLLDIIPHSRKNIQTYRKKKDEMFGKSKLGINPVSYFVQTLYNECKTHRVTPPIAVKWTRDILDFFSVKNSSLGSYPNLNEQILEDMPERNKDSYKGDDNSNQANYIISYTEYSSISTVQKDPSVNEFDLPLVSKVSFFIDRKKAEINKLLELEEKVRVKIREQVKQRANIESKIQNLVGKYEEKFRYLEQYKNLEQELYAKYKLKLDNEMSHFVKQFLILNITTTNLGV
ncbi:helix-turn-helix domain-containing protein [Candidatus Nitrosocosmicus franklandus]|uniref:Uncharacterized protein n=1 Tax=Candidatus Nitrosocosmicus franklandianus TaxID=1798806 RepID=A0A484IC32_9ARCH|nr:helix-turn-helix domain-containing protein [Candidatus Nitrosocosmicus franklandus]VFJ14344.1 protein of unknown function [Candidatus Nitrosocosmicus franklandus]